MCNAYILLIQIAICDNHTGIAHRRNRQCIGITGLASSRKIHRNVVQTVFNVRTGGILNGNQLFDHGRTIVAGIGKGVNTGEAPFTPLSVIGRIAIGDRQSHIIAIRHFKIGQGKFGHGRVIAKHIRIINRRIVQIVGHSRSNRVFYKNILSDCRRIAATVGNRVGPDDGFTAFGKQVGIIIGGGHFLTQIAVRNSQSCGFKFSEGHIGGQVVTAIRIRIDRHIVQSAGNCRISLVIENNILDDIRRVAARIREGVGTMVSMVAKSGKRFSNNRQCHLILRCAIIRDAHFRHIDYKIHKRENGESRIGGTSHGHIGDSTGDNRGNIIIQDDILRNLGDIPASIYNGINALHRLVTGIFGRNQLVLKLQFREIGAVIRDGSSSSLKHIHQIVEVSNRAGHLIHTGNRHIGESALDHGSMYIPHNESSRIESDTSVMIRYSNKNRIQFTA